MIEFVVRAENIKTYDDFMKELKDSNLDKVIQNMALSICSTGPYRDVIFSSDPLPIGVKTILETASSKNDYLIAKFAKYGVTASSYIMCDIKDVNVLVEGKVVIVTFTDGSSEKAVLTGSDTYSLEQGISICITKKLLSDKSNGNGSNLYNKIIDRAVKKYNKAQKETQKAEEQKKAAEAKYQKLVAKKAAKRAKREAAAREEKINIQKEAIIRAMKELNSSPADVSV